MKGQTMSSNPTISSSSYDRARVGLSGGTATMTVGGTITKTAILLLLVLASFGFGWTQMSGSDQQAANIGALAVGASVLAMVLSLIISFRPSTVRVLAPVFALAEGLVLGVVSALFEQQYPGIVIQAATGTFGVFASMLILYRTRVIRVTARLRSIVSIAMMAIFFTYLISFVLTLFGSSVPYINDASPIGIGFSILVILVAAFMLLTDFDFVERGARDGAPASMEWYGAFAMLVSLVWIYVEILRLLSKLRSR